MTNVPETDGTDNGIRGRVAILIMDTTREGAGGALDGWLGEQNAARVRAHRSRYVVILTIDTGRDPRYAHSIGCVPDMPTVIGELAKVQRLVERIGYDSGLCSPGTPNACMADMRLRLNENDTAAVDSWLADLTREFLLRPNVTAGCA
jgi:hypothetical protein